jgi:hypothetical protein
LTHHQIAALRDQRTVFERKVRPASNRGLPDRYPSGKPAQPFGGMCKYSLDRPNSAACRMQSGFGKKIATTNCQTIHPQSLALDLPGRFLQLSGIKLAVA